MNDEAKWKKRFQLFMAARLFGAATVVAGVVIMFSDLLREGGWPAVGGVLVAVGLIDALVAPKLLKKHWEQEDSGDARR